MAASPLPPLPEEAFVTFADARFLPLCEVLVRGLARFSSRPVMVFGIDTDVGFDAPNLIKRRIDSGGRFVYYLKLRVLLECGLGRGVFLDADNVPNRGIDRLFDACGEAGEHPLLPRHPSDLGAHLHRELMAELGVERKSMPYVHSCCLAFSRRNRPFLEECYRIAQDLERRGTVPLAYDESIVNVLLWRAGATRQLESCNIHHGFCEGYLDGSFRDDPEFQRRYGSHPYRFDSFHYCKDPARAEWMLESLSERLSEIAVAQAP